MCSTIYYLPVFLLDKNTYNIYKIKKNPMMENLWPTAEFFGLLIPSKEEQSGGTVDWPFMLCITLKS